MALLIVCITAPLLAHEGLHEQIAAVTTQIAWQPHNAELYLKRAELHRLHREWRLAARDYDRAAALDPALPRLELARGTMHFEAGQLSAAFRSLRRYVDRNRDDPRGRVVLGRVLMRTGRPLDASVEFSAVLRDPSHFDPDLVLENARALAAAGRPQEALAFLDQMLERHGPTVTLQLAAIDLELDCGNLAGALRRVDAAEAQAVRKESWLARRGDILVNAGRTAEAHAAYRAALAVIETLPPERRRTRATSRLEARMRRIVK